MGCTERKMTIGGLGVPRRVVIVMFILLAPFASRSGKLAAYARLTSTVPELAVRRVPLALSPSALVVDEQTARVFVTTSVNVSMLDAHTGMTLRVLVAPSAKRRPGFAPAMALDPQRGHVFVGRGNTLSVLDAASGRTLRTVALAQAADRLVIDVPRDRVLVFDCGAIGRVAVVDATSGAVLDTKPGTTGGCRSRPMLNAASGRVFISTATGLSVFDVVTGRLQGSIPLSVPSDMIVAARQSRVFVLSGVGSYNPTVAMLDARSLRVLRRISYGPFQNVVSLGGFLGGDEMRNHVFLYLLSPLGLQVLDAASGKVLPTTAEPDLGATAGAIDPDTGYLYVSCIYDIDQFAGPRFDNGRVDVLDIRNGTTLATAVIGYFPTTITVSRRLRRVYVLVANPASGLGRIDIRHSEIDILNMLPAQRQ